MNEIKTAMIAKSKVKLNGPTFCNLDGGSVDSNKQIDPKPADNTKRLFENWMVRNELLVYLN